MPLFDPCPPLCTPQRASSTTIPGMADNPIRKQVDAVQKTLRGIPKNVIFS